MHSPTLPHQLLLEPRPPPEEVVDRLVHRSDDQDMVLRMDWVVGLLGCWELGICARV